MKKLMIAAVLLSSAVFANPFVETEKGRKCIKKLNPEYRQCQKECREDPRLNASMVEACFDGCLNDMRERAEACLAEED